MPTRFLDSLSSLSLTALTASTCQQKYDVQVNTYNLVTYAALGLALLTLSLRYVASFRLDATVLVIIECFSGIVMIAIGGVLFGPLAPTCPEGCEPCIGNFVNYYAFICIILGVWWLLRGYTCWKEDVAQMITEPSAERGIKGGTPSPLSTVTNQTPTPVRSISPGRSITGSQSSSPNRRPPLPPPPTPPTTSNFVPSPSTSPSRKNIVQPLLSDSGSPTARQPAPRSPSTPQRSLY